MVLLAKQIILQLLRYEIRLKEIILYSRSLSDIRNIFLLCAAAD